MTEVSRVGDMEIDQDVKYERRVWVAQRIGWTLMLLLVVAALLGLLGQAPLTRLTAGEEGGPLWVEYYRFERSEGPSEIKVNLKPSAAGGNEARVWVSRQYFEAIDLDNVVPEPDRVEAGPDRLTYVFGVSEPGKPTAVRFHFTPQQVGQHPVRVGLDGGGEVSFRQMVYP